MVEALIIRLCLLFGSKTSDKLHMWIEICLIRLKHDVHEYRCHALIVYLDLFCPYAVFLVEAFDSRGYLLLQAFYEIHFFSRILHSDGLFDDLNGPSIWSFSLQISNNIVLPQSPLIELQLFLQLELLNPHRPIFLQVKLYLLNTLLEGQFDYVVNSPGDILILKQKGNDQARQRIIIKQIFTQYLPILQSIIDHQQIYHQGCKLFIIFYKAIVGVFRRVYDLRILELQVRPEQLDTKLEDVLVPAVMTRNNLDYFRRDVGVAYLMVDLFWSCTKTFDEVRVVKQHLAPYVALTVGKAIVIEMLLPARSVIAEQLQADLVEADETLSEHFMQSRNVEYIALQGESKRKGRKGRRT